MSFAYSLFGSPARSTGNFGTFLETVNQGRTATGKAEAPDDMETTAKEALRQLYRSDGMTFAELGQKMALSTGQVEPVATYLVKAGLVDCADSTLRLTSFAADALNIFDLS